MPPIVNAPRTLFRPLKNLNVCHFEALALYRFCCHFLGFSV